MVFNKKTSFFFILIIIQFNLIAGPLWRKLTANPNFGTADQQIFCHESKENYSADNDQNLAKLASVTKLFVTQMALVKWGADRDFPIDISYDQNTHDLYIKGEHYPLVGDEFLFVLLSELNKAGISKVRNIYWDERLKFHPTANGYNLFFGKFNIEGIKNYLKNIFSPQIWETITYDNYHQSLSSKYNFVKNKYLPNNNERIYLNDFPIMNITGDVYFTSINTQHDHLFTIETPKLYEVLKQMNAHSLNFVAEILFQQLGGSEYFSQIAQNLGYSDENFILYTGSGLNKNDDPNYSNQASCSLVLSVMKSIHQEIETQGYHLSDILPVAGHEKSTLLKYYNYNDINGKVLGKTGSLGVVSSFAGIIPSEQGIQYFAMFNQKDRSSRKVTEGIRKNIHYPMLQALTRSYGEVTIDFSPSKFFPIKDIN